MPGIQSQVLLLGGSRTAAFTSRDLLARLHRTHTMSEVEILDGMKHNVPDENLPSVSLTA
jgi:hypothetical protein